MSVVYRATEGLSSGEEEFTVAGTMAKHPVGSIEFNGTTLDSITRELPAWDDFIGWGCRIAIDGPATGNVTTEDCLLGFCSGHTRRYGQAGEYALGCTALAHSGSWTGEVYANTSPTPNENYQYYKSMWPSLVNAGVFSNFGGGGKAFRVSRLNQDMSDADNATHWNTSWSHFFNWIRKIDTNSWEYGMLFNTSTNVWPTRHLHEVACFDMTRKFSFHNREVIGIPGKIKSSVTQNVDSTFFWNGTIDEATYGDMKHINIAWKASNANLHIRDICVMHSRNPSDGIYP